VARLSQATRQESREEEQEWAHSVQFALGDRKSFLEKILLITSNEFAVLSSS
jgi:hypothetical protein